MSKIIFLMIIPFLFFGCTTIEHLVREEPVGKEEASQGIGVDITDSTISRHIGVNIKKADADLEYANININVFNSVVLLTGEAPNQRLKTIAGDTARSIKGVRVVHNELKIRPNSTIPDRGVDSMITAKVKIKLALDEEVTASDIDVITEDNVVYLMGVVPKMMGEKAANRAQETGGVRRVVKVFEYID